MHPLRERHAGHLRGRDALLRGWFPGVRRGASSSPVHIPAGKAVLVGLAVPNGKLFPLVRAATASRS